MPPEVTQVTHKHVYDGPIMRNRAKILQKEVNSNLKLTSIYLRMLYCLNILLWFYLGMYINKIGTSSNQATNSRQPVRTSLNQFGQPVRTTKRNKHKSWFPKDLKAHEYPLEILNLLSNPTSFTSFRLPNQDLWSNHWRLLRMSRVCPRIYLAQTSRPSLYHSTMFHGACYTCLESL